MSDGVKTGIGESVRERGRAGGRVCPRQRGSLRSLSGSDPPERLLGQGWGELEAEALAGGRLRAPLDPCPDRGASGTGSCETGLRGAG